DVLLGDGNERKASRLFTEIFRRKCLLRLHHKDSSVAFNLRVKDSLCPWTKPMGDNKIIPRVLWYIAQQLFSPGHYV
ncbi:MAG: hypothetical protein ACREXS_08760, partial [Gammaproteobacteria bacterium]